MSALGFLAKVLLPPLLGYGLTRMTDEGRRRRSKRDMDEAYRLKAKYDAAATKRKIGDYVKYYPKIAKLHEGSRKRALDDYEARAKKRRSFKYKEM